MTAYNYSETRRGDLVDELHGVKVPDPYRWLEDPKSEETQVLFSIAGPVANCRTLSRLRIRCSKIISPDFRI
jgi:Prolyl oligopeptidase, N-terminal beta-propeller domain